MLFIYYGIQEKIKQFIVNRKIKNYNSKLNSPNFIETFRCD